MTGAAPSAFDSVRDYARALEQRNRLLHLEGMDHLG